MCAEIAISSLEHTGLEAHPFTSRVSLERIRDAPKGEMSTYSATPLDRVATLTQQLDLRVDLQEPTYRNIPNDAPFEVYAYIHSLFIQRFNKRGEANEENFITSLHYGDYRECLDPEVVEIVDRARFGHASPAELLLVREQLGIRSIELACQSHPYGTNIEMLDEMRFAIEYAVSLYGGEYFEEPETIYCVKEAIDEIDDMPDFTNGVLMTRKSTLGVLDDGTVIKERSSFVLRTDEASGFDQTIIKRLQAELIKDPAIDWMEWLIKEGNLDMIAADLLDNNDFLRAIPVSTTAYAFHSETTRQVYETLDQTRVDRIEKYRYSSPEMYRLLMGETAVHLAQQIAIGIERKKTMAIRILDEKALKMINPFGSHKRR